MRSGVWFARWIERNSRGLVLEPEDVERIAAALAPCTVTRGVHLDVLDNRSSR